jgi:ribosomal protein L40E
MSKAKSDPNTLRFKCAKCQSVLKVNISYAGKYIDCPKCHKKTSVPASQKEADDEMREYTVSKSHFDVPAKCTKCGAKLPKGAVLCVECGFDYRHGKQHDVMVTVPLEGEPVRGGLALKFMIGESLILAAVLGLFIWRGPAADQPKWWENGLYLSGMLFLLALVPKHLMQWLDYRKIPLRDSATREDEDRAEHHDATEPYGRATILLFLLAVGVGIGLGYLMFGRGTP